MRIYKVLLFLLVLLHGKAFGQGHIQVHNEGNKYNRDSSTTLHIFKGEILYRDSQYSYEIPGNERIILGKGKDIWGYQKKDKLKTPRKLSESNIKRIIKEQGVFLEDGQLHKGYLIDLSFLDRKNNLIDTLVRKPFDIVNSIYIAHNLSAPVTLKEGGDSAKSKYPYHASGLLYFHPTREDFKDDYIRIIIPGYESSFIEKDKIQRANPEFTYDKEIFDEKKITNNGEHLRILINRSDSTFYPVTKKYALLKGTGLTDGSYPLTKGDKELVIHGNTVAIRTTPKPRWFENTLTQLIGGIALLSAIVLGTWALIKRRKARYTIYRVQQTSKGRDIGHELGMSWEVIANFNNISNNPKKDISADTKLKIPQNHPHEVMPFGSQAETNDDSVFQYQSSSPSASLIGPKDLNKQLQGIKEGQDETQRVAKLILQQIESGDSQQTNELQKELQKAEVRIRQLQADREQQNESIKDLSIGMEKSNEHVQLVQEENLRFRNEAYFLRNYTDQLTRFFTLFDRIRSLEKHILDHSFKNGDERTMNFLSLIYTKFRKSTSGDLFDSWHQILKTLEKNNGLITDKELIKRLESKKDEQEKIRIITWLLTNEVIPPRLGALLILIEEVRNTDKITATPPSPIRQEMTNAKEELISAMKPGFDIDVEDIELYKYFSSYDNIHTHNIPTTYDISSVTPAPDFGDILEIKTYGMKLKEKTIETIVIAK